MPGPVFRANDRVALRTVAPVDADFLARCRNDPQVRRWFPSARVVTHAVIEEEMERRAGSDEGAQFVITPPDDDRRLGFAGLFDIDDTAGTGEIGAWLAPEAQERGLGTATTRELVAYAFAERRLHKVVARAAAHNERSQATLETVGFTEEARLRERHVVDGEWVDRVDYGLLRREWVEET